VRDPEQTLHLERSELEAAPAPPAPAPPAAPSGQYQPTMVMGAFPATPRKASVQVRSGPDSGARYALEASPIYIGRAPDNGIVVKDPATSRRHARFEMRGQDYLVVDLGSANGTLVDGKRVVELVLAAGAIITMGQNEFVVSIS
jgi:pSer/pThr/pTyr-binding forkhead associated (FHA) protein